MKKIICFTMLFLLVLLSLPCIALGADGAEMPAAPQAGEESAEAAKGETAIQPAASSAPQPAGSPDAAAGESAPEPSGENGEAQPEQEDGPDYILVIPEKLSFGNLLTYDREREVSLPFTLELTELAPGKRLSVTAVQQDAENSFGMRSADGTAVLPFQLWNGNEEILPGGSFCIFDAVGTAEGRLVLAPEAIDEAACVPGGTTELAFSSILTFQIELIEDAEEAGQTGTVQTAVPVLPPDMAAENMEEPTKNTDVRPAEEE